mgnify:CR=1 FL=1
MSDLFDGQAGRRTGRQVLIYNTVHMVKINWAFEQIGKNEKIKNDRTNEKTVYLNTQA